MSGDDELLRLVPTPTDKEEDELLRLVPTPTDKEEDELFRLVPTPTDRKDDKGGEKTPWHTFVAMYDKINSL